MKMITRYRFRSRRAMEQARRSDQREIKENKAPLSLFGNLCGVCNTNGANMKTDQGAKYCWQKDCRKGLS